MRFLHLTILIICFNFTNIFCQSPSYKKLISFNFNDLYIGKNMSLEYGFCVDSAQRNMLNFGLKYHDNNPILDNQYHLFKDRFYAESFFEHLGITIGYNKILYFNSFKINLYLFGQTDFSYISMHNVARRPLEPTPDNTPVYEESYFTTPPWLTIESRIGIGAIIPVFYNFSLKQSLGFGIAYFIPFEEENSVVIITDNYWEIMSSFSIGIVYSLDK